MQSQLDIANAEKIEWKKIVEKLACCYLDLAVPSDKDKDWLKPKPKYLIDWARKEVEK